ncbi:MAG: competence/damage-inducible protein A [Legionellaceae bacterium]|nr:competence/damage-inducible protein A [Legionellaceae bacterium]
MTIAFLVTGDEIVHGDTLNTNSQKLAQALCAEELSLGSHLCCSDKEDDLLESLAYLSRRHEIIMITGGLGPTSDDRTRFALARHLQTPLQEFPEASQHIQSYFAKAGSPKAKNNDQQALFPAGSQLLANPYGTAMGAVIRNASHTYILLPGPPRECIPMFNDHVLPLLVSGKHSGKDILRWRLFGVAESEIARLFEDALADYSCQTGYRLETPYVEVKVRFPKGEKDNIRQTLDPLLQPYIISPLHQSASSRLREMLENWTIPFSIHDTVSGGILQSLIQSPKNHKIVQFTTTPLQPVHFNLRGFHEYWAGMPAKEGKSKITIEYQNAELLGSEEHLVPCRSTMVLHYAAEWLSFRLFHLLNQLH